MKGQWCTCVLKKTEAKVWSFLTLLHPSFRKQVSFDWCRNELHAKRTKLPFDFTSESLRIIVELDGRQHFVQVSIWTSPEVTNQRDRYKVQQALTHGYSVIRILQEDVWYDRIDWKSLLSREIERCSQLSVPELVFINYPEEYRRMFEEPEVEIIFEDEPEEEYAEIIFE